MVCAGIALLLPGAPQLAEAAPGSSSLADGSYLRVDLTTCDRDRLVADLEFVAGTAEAMSNPTIEEWLVMADSVARAAITLELLDMSAHSRAVIVPPGLIVRMSLPPDVEPATASPTWAPVDIEAVLRDSDLVDRLPLVLQSTSLLRLDTEPLPPLEPPRFSIETTGSGQTVIEIRNSSSNRQAVIVWASGVGIGNTAVARPAPVLLAQLARSEAVMSDAGSPVRSRIRRYEGDPFSPLRQVMQAQQREERTRALRELRAKARSASSLIRFIDASVSVGADVAIAASHHTVGRVVSLGRALSGREWILFGNPLCSNADGSTAIDWCPRRSLELASALIPMFHAQMWLRAGRPGISSHLTRGALASDAILQHVSLSTGIVDYADKVTPFVRARFGGDQAPSRNVLAVDLPVEIDFSLDGTVEMVGIEGDRVVVDNEDGEQIASFSLDEFPVGEHLIGDTMFSGQVYVLPLYDGNRIANRVLLNIIAVTGPDGRTTLDLRYLGVSAGLRVRVEEPLLVDEFLPIVIHEYDGREYVGRLRDGMRDGSPYPRLSKIDVLMSEDGRVPILLLTFPVAAIPSRPEEYGQVTLPFLPSNAAGMSLHLIKHRNPLTESLYDDLLRRSVETTQEEWRSALSRTVGLTGGELVAAFRPAINRTAAMRYLETFQPELVASAERDIRTTRSAWLSVFMTSRHHTPPNMLGASYSSVNATDATIPLVGQGLLVDRQDAGYIGDPIAGSSAGAVFGVSTSRRPWVAPTLINQAEWRSLARSGSGAQAAGRPQE